VIHLKSKKRVNMKNIKIKLKLFITNYIRYLIYKNFRHYAWPRRLSTRLFDFDYYYKSDNEPSGLVKRVNIGAGPYFKRSGWASADYMPHFKGGKSDLIHLDLLEHPDKFPFENLEAIYASHTLEHFHIDWTKRLIKSAYNSLDMGGYFRIAVPDASLILDKVRTNDFEYFKFFESFFINHKNTDINVYDYGLLMLCQPRCRFDRFNVRENSGNEYLQNLISAKTDDEIVCELNNHNFENDELGTYHLSCYTDTLLIKLLQEAGFTHVYRSAFMQSKYGPMREAPVFDGTHPWLSLYVEAVK
jgi:hypothetical protein